MLRIKNLLVVLFSLALVMTACEKKEEAKAEGADQAAAEETEEPAADDKKAEEKSAEKAEEEKAEGEELAAVDVPKEGKKFDPAVKAEQIPAGAWFCDMGTVHYARGEKGDGVCPECNMKLKHKAADGGEEAAEKAAHKGEMDHAGHGHE